MEHLEVTRRFARKAEVCKILACGGTHVFELVRKGELTPIRLSPRFTAYDLAEVNALADAAIAKARASNANAV